MSTYDLLNYDYQGLRDLMVELGEKPFRAQQLLKWIHQQRVDDFAEMTDLSKALRAKLTEQATVSRMKIIFDHLSNDGTRKWLIELDDGNKVETVYIPEKNRGTLCVSSQVGCALNCQFCATATQGFNRNLSVAEIIGQVREAVIALAAETTPRKVTNVVMMGMGEPLMNTDNVLPAMNLMQHDLAYGLSKYRVTLSTSGVVPEMRRLAKASDAALAVSLHAPNDELRNQLVPINKKYPLSALMSACKEHFPRDSKRHITFEYVMLAGVNDTPKHAKQLIRLLQGVRGKVNLIPFNSYKTARYTCSKAEDITKFRDILSNAGLITTIRRTRGDDVAAACGQLVGDFKDRTSRSARHLRQWQESQQAAAN